MDYIAYLHKDRNSDFGVSFPDFPGCITAGKTLEEASQMAAEALALHIAGMIEDGVEIPEPSNLDALATDPLLKDAVAFLVHVEPETSRTVRINITARENQLEQIDQLAASAGMTRSAYMVQSALNNGNRRKKQIDDGRRGWRPTDSMSMQGVRSYQKKYSHATESAKLLNRKKKA